MWPPNILYQRVSIVPALYQISVDKHDNKRPFLYHCWCPVCYCFLKKVAIQRFLYELLINVLLLRHYLLSKFDIFVHTFAFTPLEHEFFSVVQNSMTVIGNISFNYIFTTLVMLRL